MISRLALASFQLLVTSAVSSSLPIFAQFEEKSANLVFPPTPGPDQAVDFSSAIYAAHFWKVYDRVISSGGTKKEAHKAALKHVRTLGIPQGAIYTPFSGFSGETNEITDRRNGDAHETEDTDDLQEGEDNDFASRDKAILQNFEAILRKNFDG